MRVRRYRKKPVVIEAVRVPVWDGTSSIVRLVDECIAIAEWCGGFSHMMDPSAGVKFDPSAGVKAGIHIPTLEGTMIASPGDWIIRGVQGEFYPCKPDIFTATYEEET